MDIITIKHSFNAGDLICILPGLRQLYRDTGKKIRVYQRLNLPSFYYDGQVNSTVNKDGNSVCFNEVLFKMMKPLIEAQDYIDIFCIWEGQETQLDYDLSRDTKSVPMPAGLLHTYTEAVFPQTSTDLSEPWLTLGGFSGNNKKEVIVNITQRYNNPYVTYYFLKEYESVIMFSGTEIEHEVFCKKYNLKLDLLVVEDFFQLARWIAGFKFGIFSQSLHWHLADAIKSPRILEVCAAFPNTFATGKNGYHAFGQASMEFYVNKLINK